MLLRSLRLRGIGPFRREVHLDLADLPRIVAVVGPNGAGKSTLLGSFVAALERAFPGDDPFVDGRPLARLATSRDAFLEAEVLNGAAYRIRHLVDAVSGKGESVVLDAEGKPLVASSKVSEFDRWRAEHLPPREVLLTSIFAAQGSGGFLDMTSGQRKGVVLRTLRIERYEALASRAREHAAEARDRLDSLSADIRLEGARGSVEAIAAARKAVDVAKEAAARADDALAGARARLEGRRVEHAAAEAAAREGEAARLRHQAAKDRAAAAAKAVREAEKKVRDLEEVLAARERVEKAVARQAELDVLIQESEERARGQDDVARAARALAGAAMNEQISAQDRIDVAGRAAAKASDRLKDRERIEEAVRSLQAARDAVVRVEQELAAARSEVDRVAGLKVAGAEERITGLRDGLVLIRDAREQGHGDVDFLCRFAADVLVRDDATVTAAAEVPVLDRKARVERDRLQEAEKQARRSLEALERAAARVPEMEAAAAELTRAEEERAAATVVLEGARARRQEQEGIASAAEAEAARERGVLLGLRQERGAAFEDARLAPRLAAAEAKLEELRPALEAARAEASAADEALRLAPDPGAPVVVPVLDREERAVQEAEKAVQAASSGIGRADEGLAAAERVAARIAELESQRRGVEDEVSDWNRLAEDLGRKGLQALEIDAAGPELTAIVNDLLREAFGVRYTLNIETTRPRDKDGEPIEVFDLRVIDLEHGYEGTVDGLSGGQRTIVGEAMRLALTTLATRRHGFGELTLVRDESGAALDQENGPAWVAMLRRAADLVGAKQVLYVTHDPALAMLADARVRVTQEGTVQVE